nr:hypothetical protein [uncultured Gellertiella sp.]
MTETAENAADQAEGAAAREIDAKIAALGDWRDAGAGAGADPRGLIPTFATVRFTLESKCRNHENHW